MASEVKEEKSSTPPKSKIDDESGDAQPANEAKASDKESVKKEKKEKVVKKPEKNDEDDDDEDDDDDDEDEREVALLDRPVEVSGCRARKMVDRLTVAFPTPKEKQDIPEGKGKKLGECPRIELQIQKLKASDLKPFHRVLFNRNGAAHEIKKNIRKFSGFPFEKGSSEFTKKKASVDKLKTPVLKKICLILDIERSGTKDDIVNRIMSFLLNPEDSGKKVPATKKKAAKEKKKSSAKKVKSDKNVKSDKDDSDDEPEESIEEDDDDSTCGEASMGGTDEEAEGVRPCSDEDCEGCQYCEEDFDPASKKSKETKEKSKPDKEKSKPDEAKSKPDEAKSKPDKAKSKADKAKSKPDKVKKEDKKPRGTKRKQDDSSASSDDEPIAKKTNKMPSDDEISKLVRQILDSADLQEITMKKVIKQVSDAYPDFDLSHKKGFIKSTIKSVIS